MSFIDGYLIEINQFPRVDGELYDWGLFTIKDYFYYNSQTTEYGHRDTLIPKEMVVNYFDIPEETAMKIIINNKEPVMKRVIDLNNQTENWVFVPTEETKNDY
jgi:hypothetical protein